MYIQMGTYSRLKAWLKRLFISIFMENELIKITFDQRYEETRAIILASPQIKNIDDVTLIKTPEGMFMLVHPGFGPSRVRECLTEKEAGQVLVEKMLAESLIKIVR